MSQHAQQLAPIAVSAVTSIVDLATADNVDLKNIQIAKKLGGTIEDSELVKGIVFVKQKISHQAQGPSRIANPKIGVIGF